MKEVYIRNDFPLTGRTHSVEGSGIIVHSSEKQGTYILTCWHIACVPVAVRKLEEGSSATGPVGSTVKVAIHRSACRDSSKPKFIRTVGRQGYTIKG